MRDLVLDKLERKERLFFARVVFAAKVITWAALLLLAAIIESALVIKSFCAQSNRANASGNSSPSTFATGIPGGRTLSRSRVFRNGAGSTNSFSNASNRFTSLLTSSNLARNTPSPLSSSTWLQ